MIDLSVVIPSYENEQALGECLVALAAARDARPDLRFEVLVVDNGSRDGSVERARAAPLPVRLVALARNRGFAAAVNVGLRARRGRHVLLLNSDAIVEPEVLSRGVELLEGFASIGLVGVCLVHPDGRVQRSVHAFPDWIGELLPDAIVRGWRRARIGFGARLRRARLPQGVEEVEAVRGAALFLRGDLVDRIGGFDEGYFFFLEETDYCWRTRDAGFRVVHVPSLRVIHRLGASSKARAPLATRVEYERSLARFLRRRRGPLRAGWARALRVARQGIGWTLGLPLALAITRLRRRGRERGALLLWHLRGQPASPVLAIALAESADGRSRVAGEGLSH